MGVRRVRVLVVVVAGMGEQFGGVGTDDRYLPRSAPRRRPHVHPPATATPAMCCGTDVLCRGSSTGKPPASGRARWTTSLPDQAALRGTERGRHQRSVLGTAHRANVPPVGRHRHHHRPPRPRTTTAERHRDDAPACGQRRSTARRRAAIKVIVELKARPGQRKRHRPAPNADNRRAPTRPRTPTT